MSAYAERVEERIKADFEAHPGSWRGDPLNWYREGWLAGFAARSEDGGQVQERGRYEERDSRDIDDSEQVHGAESNG